ncbi:hypothetical protein [Micromonospora sp. NPDC049679]
MPNNTLTASPLSPPVRPGRTDRDGDSATPADGSRELSRRQSSSARS